MILNNSWNLEDEFILKRILSDKYPFNNDQSLISPNHMSKFKKFVYFPQIEIYEEVFIGVEVIFMFDKDGDFHKSSCNSYIMVNSRKTSLNGFSLKPKIMNVFFKNVLEQIDGDKYVSFVTPSLINLMIYGCRGFLTEQTKFNPKNKKSILEHPEIKTLAKKMENDFILYKKTNYILGHL